MQKYDVLKNESFQFLGHNKILNSLLISGN